MALEVRMKPTLFTADTDVLSLETYMEHLALECQFTQNLADLFRNVVPAFKTRLQQLNDQLTHFSKKEDGALQLVQQYDKGVKTRSGYDAHTQAALTNVQQFDMLVFGEHLVDIPENFKGSLPLYASTLCQILETGLRHQGIMDSFNQYLSVFITNPEMRNQAAPITSQHQTLHDYREQSIATLKTFFPKDTGISKAPLKRVLERFADLEDLIQPVHKIAYYLDIKVLHSYQERLQQTIHLLDLIIEQYSRKEIPDVSPAIVTALSQNVYEVARYVEFIGLLQYDGRVCLNVVNLLIMQLAYPYQGMTDVPMQAFKEPKTSKVYQSLQSLWQLVHQSA